jgi:uncharacterized protein (TIGR00255 family)
MTGFGRGESAQGSVRIAAEIKTVNHRYSEITVKIPKRFIQLEDRIRQHLAASINRGKVDIYIKAEYGDDGQDVRIDNSLALKYHMKIQDLADSLGIPMDLGVAELITIPGILTIEDSPVELDEIWEVLKPPIDSALAQVLNMRNAEGMRLANDFIARLEYMETLRKNLLDYSPGVVEKYRQRLTARITELMGQIPVDENRLIQEVAMFADRSGVDEELVRLDSHFRQFWELISSDQPVGRQLDFLCQEMNREINTIGSKANDISMTKTVVELKGEVEKLREQAQNIQ